MDEALVSWLILVFFFGWRAINRFCHGLQRSIHKSPSTYYFILLLMGSIVAIYQAYKLEAGHITRPLICISILLFIAVGIESVCNKRTWIAVVWQYQFLTLLTFSIFVVKTLLDIFRYEFQAYDYNWAPPAQIKKDLREHLRNWTKQNWTNFTTDHEINEEVEALEWDDSLRIISGIGVFAAFCTVCVVVWHTYALVKQMALQECRILDGAPVTFSEMCYRMSSEKLSSETLAQQWFNLPKREEEAPVASGKTDLLRASMDSVESLRRRLLQFCPEACNDLFNKLQEPVAANSRSKKFDFTSLHELRHDLVLQIVLLPLIFAFLALRSNLRAIRIFNGSLEKQLRGGLSWEQAKDFNMHMFDANLDLASAAEIYTSFCLLRFCLDIVDDKVKALKELKGDQQILAKDLSSTLKNTSLQGVMSFVLIGSIKAFVTLVYTVIELYQNLGSKRCQKDFQIFSFICGAPGDIVEWNVIEAALGTAKTTLQPIMVLTSLQCIWNMMSICGFSIKIVIAGKAIIDVAPFDGMTELKSAGFDKKLTGVRILILIAQVQNAILQIITKEQVLKEASEFGVAPDVKPWKPIQVKVVHASLICIECLGVALLQANLWRWHEIEKILQREQKRRMGDMSDDRAVSEPAGFAFGGLSMPFLRKNLSEPLANSGRSSQVAASQVAASMAPSRPKARTDPSTEAP